MVNRPPDTPLDPSLDQAADWHARLAGDAEQTVWLGFTEWLEADPRHRAAYDQVERLWRQLDAVPAQATPVIDMASRRRTVPAPANQSRRWFLGGVGAAAATVAVMLSSRYATIPEPESFASAPGQRRTVQLADGSRIILNSGTRLSVALASDGRAVILERGEALFDVAKDPSRPFTVAAGEQLVTVVGTAFNVRNLDQTVTVTVTRGLVDVADKGGGAKVRLTQGQQVSTRHGQVPRPIQQVDVLSVTAWTDGRLVFDNAPLPQVLAELSRHYPVPMRAEGAAAQLHFSGVLRLDADQAALTATLQALLPVAVTRQGDRFVLSKRF